MNKVLGIVLISLLIIGFSTLLYAGGGASTQGETVASYRLDVGNKAERGVKNVLFGWTEIPKKVVDITKETKNPIWGLLAGTFQGTLKAMARTVSGVSDVATAPINPSGDPMIQPEINVE